MDQVHSNVTELMIAGTDTVGKLIHAFIDQLKTRRTQAINSSQQGLLLVPFARTSTKQSLAFSMVRPSTWNGLPSQLSIFCGALSPAFFLTFRLLFLAVLESGAPLSRFFEEALYKCSI